ncbi:MAG: sugar phosphate isomerase/epimerase family protein, partial [Pseudothermotoga sp.]
PVNLASSRQEDLQIMLKIFEIASTINASVIVYHCAYRRGDKKSFEKEVQTIKMIANKLKSSVLALENTHQMIDEVLEVVEAVASEKVRLLIDVGHLYIRCNADRSKFFEQVEMGLEKTVEIHVHDNFGKPSVGFDESIGKAIHFAYLYGVGDLHLPLGLGTIPFDDLFALLKRKFDGFVVLEINDLNRFKADIPKSLSLLREKLC